MHHDNELDDPGVDEVDNVDNLDVADSAWQDGNAEG